MTPEDGKWILLCATIAWSTHVAKIITLYILLWRRREEGRKQPMQLWAFMFLLMILVLFPYQDPKASKVINRFLMLTTILQYVSWIALAYIILIWG